MALKAVLFDMDGVLFNSMPYHAVAWAKAMSLKDGEVLLLENVRFYKAEEIKDKKAKEDPTLRREKDDFAKQIAELGDVLSCQRDAALIEGFNPDVTLTRTQTIMQGASHCDFRYRATDPDTD